MRKIIFLLAILTLFITSFAGTCEAEAEATVTWDVSWELPDCAPADAKTWAARVDKFNRGYEKQKQLYDTTIAELRTVLGMASDATAADIKAKIDAAANITCTFTFTFEASVEAEFKGEAAADKDEAKLMGEGKVEAELKMESKFECTGEITDPVFKVDANLEKIAALIKKLKEIHVVSLSLQKKSVYLIKEGLTSILALVKNVADCPQLVAKYTELEKQFKEGFNKVEATASGSIQMGTDSNNIIVTFNDKFGN